MQDKQRGMPIVFRSGNDDAALSGAVWQCTESTEALGESLSLSPESRALLASFRSERRRREWLTVRRLLNELHPDQPAPEILYSGNGRPSLSDGSHISISHSEHYVTLCWSRSHRLGCDLESIRPQINRLAGKFVGSQEREFLGEHPSLEALHLVWGAKESLFKLYGSGGVDFRKELEVSSFQIGESGTLRAAIRKTDFNLDTLIHYRFFDDMLLVYTAHPA